MRDRTEKQALAVIAFVGLAFFANLFFRACTAQAAENRQLEAVVAYLSDYLKLYEKRRQDALALLPAFIAAAREHNLDPLLFAVHISAESAWRPEVVGSRGEIGLTQIIPKGACSVDGLEQPEVQLRAGAACLARCFEMCGRQGDKEAQRTRAFTAYLTGKCETESEKVLRRARHRAARVAAAEKEFYKEVDNAL